MSDESSEQHPAAPAGDVSRPGAGLRAAHTAETLSRINEILLSALTVDDVLERLVGEASVAARADKSLVIEVCGDAYTVTHVRNVREGVAGVRHSASFFPGFELAASLARPLLIGDTATDPRTNKDFVVPYGLRAFQLLPLTVDDHVGYVLALAYDAPQSFDESDEVAAERMMNAMSLALRNVRLYEAQRAAVAELAQAKQRLDAQIDNSPLAIVEFDAASRVVRWSAEAERVFGWTAEEVLGREMLDIPWIYEEDMDLVEQEDTRLKTGTGRSVNMNRNVRKDGRVIWCEWYDSAVYDEHGEMVSIFSQVLDITERMAVETALRDSEEKYRGLFTNLIDGFALHQVVLDAESTPVDYVFLEANDAFGAMTGLDPRAIVGRRATEVLPGIADDPADWIGTYGRVALTGVTHKFEQHAASLGRWYSVSAYSPRHGQFVTVFEDITARKQAEDDLRASRSQIEAERRNLRTIIDEMPVGVSLLDRQGAVIETNAASSAIWGGEAPDVEAVGDHGMYRAFDRRTGERLRGDQLPTVRTLATRDIVTTIADVERFDGSRGTVRFTSVPILEADGSLDGAILLAEDVTDELERQRLNEALNEIGTTISATLDYEELLRRLLLHASVAVGAESTAIICREGEEWVVGGVTGLADALVGARLTEGEVPLAALAVEAGAPVSVYDLGDEPEVGTGISARFGARSFMSVPLAAQGAAVAVIAFLHADRASAFTEAQVEFAGRLQGVASLAIENAKLYERERRIADTLQEAILAPLPSIEGIESACLYRPASATAHVGGDFYDVFDLDDGKVAIVVGDVSGKGLEAARLTFMLRDGIRAYALGTANPASTLERANELVRRSSPVDAFATVFLGVLDLGTGWLHYTSAGHPAPLLCGADEVGFLLATPGSIVGAFSGAKFGFGEAQLHPGQFLLLYTDGVLEARAGEEFFGEERLFEAAHEVVGEDLEAIPSAIVGRVLDFAGGTLRDDTVVMCVRWTGPASDADE